MRMGALMLLAAACLPATLADGGGGAHAAVGADAPLYPPREQEAELVFGCNMGRSHCVQFFEVSGARGVGQGAGARPVGLGRLSTTPRTPCADPQAAAGAGLSHHRDRRLQARRAGAPTGAWATRPREPPCLAGPPRVVPGRAAKGGSSPPSSGPLALPRGGRPPGAPPTQSLTASTWC